MQLVHNDGSSGRVMTLPQEMMRVSQHQYLQLQQRLDFLCEGMCWKPRSSGCAAAQVANHSCVEKLGAWNILQALGLPIILQGFIGGYNPTITQLLYCISSHVLLKNFVEVLDISVTAKGRSKNHGPDISIGWIHRWWYPSVGDCSRRRFVEGKGSITRLRVSQAHLQ